MTRYFINQGKKDGFSPKELMILVNENLGGKNPEIGQIEIMKMFSFFEMEKGHTKELISALSKKEFRGREISVEESKPKPAGGDRERRRSDRPRGDRDRGGDRGRSRDGGSGRKREYSGGSRESAPRRRRRQVLI